MTQQWLPEVNLFETAKKELREKLNELKFDDTYIMDVWYDRVVMELQGMMHSIVDISDGCSDEEKAELLQMMVDAFIKHLSTGSSKTAV